MSCLLGMERKGTSEFIKSSNPRSFSSQSFKYECTQELQDKERAVRAHHAQSNMFGQASQRVQFGCKVVECRLPSVFLNPSAHPWARHQGDSIRDTAVCIIVPIPSNTHQIAAGHVKATIVRSGSYICLEWRS